MAMLRKLWLAPALCVVASATCEVEEEISLLQTAPIRRHKAKKATDAKALLKSMRDVANSMSEGSASTMSPNGITAALANARDALAQLSPAIHQQVVMAQQQIVHAAAAVDVCHHGAGATTSLQQTAVQRGAAVDNCKVDLDAAVAAEQVACQRAQDCLCDEARTHLSDKQALCASMTQTYESAYCAHFVACTDTHQCHAGETRVYNALRADIEAEMAVLVQEYRTVEQTECLTSLIQTAMGPPESPIPHADLLACNNVDVSAIAISYPQLPAAPAACPQPAHGNPQCQTTTTTPAPAYQHIHGGHCAAGWLLSANMADENACYAHCQSTQNCRFFAFCDGSCNNHLNCALYDQCPDDNNFPEFEAYRIL